MKNITFLTILLLCDLYAYCQKDSIYVKTTCEYKLVNFRNTGVKIVKSQTTYDKAFKTRREVFFTNNEATLYTYNFYYPNDSIKQIQFFNNKDELIKYENYYYKKDRLVQMKAFSVSQHTSPSLIYQTKYKYKKQLTLAIKLNSDKECVSKKNSVLERNKIIQTEIEYYHSDSIINELIFNTYDGDRISSQICISTFNDNTIDTIIKKYVYDEKYLRLTKIEYFDTKSDLMYTDNFYYYLGGNLERKIRTNAEDKRIRYEFYELAKYFKEIPTKKLIEN